MALAASVTGLDFEFVKGVTEVSNKALPPGDSENKLNNGERGNWRAHMNVAQRCGVFKKLSSHPFSTH